MALGMEVTIGNLVPVVTEVGIEDKEIRGITGIIGLDLVMGAVIGEEITEGIIVVDGIGVEYNLLTVEPSVEIVRTSQRSEDI